MQPGVSCAGQKSWVAHLVRYADSLPKGFAERIARELEETLFQHGPLTYGILCLQDCAIPTLDLNDYKERWLPFFKPHVFWWYQVDNQEG